MHRIQHSDKEEEEGVGISMLATGDETEGSDTHWQPWQLTQLSWEAGTRNYLY